MKHQVETRHQQFYYQSYKKTFNFLIQWIELILQVYTQFERYRLILRLKSLTGCLWNKNGSELPSLKHQIHKGKLLIWPVQVFSAATI